MTAAVQGSVFAAMWPASATGQFALTAVSKLGRRIPTTTSQFSEIT